ncbi:hypothetical protein TSST111916_06690 [Tsukamurella strandjordii]|uniref:nSTAND1 domain-containing NTPase n=1 Tax=Tsukamurella TaxID=2060 RepID=UPI001C7DEC1B|nr:hypothetical protein [Tsukamurella sp. TY48]GIZ96537.1 hypothetical protein TTY48_11490 [Tsukamurella sp. TY48]
MVGKRDRSADEEVFAASLRQLFVAAGSPTVAQVARQVGVSAGTISHWRTGRHFPSEFATIEPLLVQLTDRAHQRIRTGASTAHEAGVLTVRQWQGLFDAAAGEEVKAPALEQIAASGERWAQASDAGAVEAARTVLVGCLETSVDGAVVPRAWAPAHSGTGGVGDVVAELIDLGVLVEPVVRSVEDEARSGHVAVVDSGLIEAWPRLSRWVADAYPALIARTGLEHDAQRWSAADRPRAWLYDHTRLELTADALTTLAGADSGDAGFRFGVATGSQIPASAIEFWEASQSAAVSELRVHQIVMAVIVVLSVMVLGLGVALGVVA